MAITIGQTYKQPTKDTVYTVTKVVEDQNATWITVQADDTVLTYGNKAFKAKYLRVKETNNDNNITTNNGVET